MNDALAHEASCQSPGEPMSKFPVFLLMLIPLIGSLGAQSSAQHTLSCGTPALIGDGWTVASPTEVGLDPQIICELDKLLAKWPEANIHAINVVRHGKLVGELYYGGTDQRCCRPESLGIVQFAPHVKHDLRSISKSVTSLLVGIALSEGTFPPLDSPVLDTFSEYADLRTAEKMRITFRHLLTMSSGLAWDEVYKPYSDPENIVWRLVAARDPVRFVLEQPLVVTPGDAFNYNSGGTTVLGRAVAKATGKRFDEYARDRLFVPLGIADFEWVPLPATGEPAAGWGLRLRPRDTAKLGQLVLADGRWGDRRVLPPGWAAESMKGRLKDQRVYHYGYQWWHGKTYVSGSAIEWAAGFGHGGQRLFVVPTLDLVVVVNAGLYDEGPYSALQERIPKEILFQVISAAAKN